ncbi:MAG: MFS transporter, partial [bacterium]
GFWAAFVVFMMYVGRLLVSLIAGNLAETYGRKRIMLTGVLLEAFALLGFGFVEQIASYSTLGFLVGFGSGMHFPAAKAALSTVPDELRGKVFSGFQVAMQVGITVGSLLGALIMITNYRIMFIGVFALFLGYVVSVGSFLENDTPALEGKERGPLLQFKAPKNSEVRSFFGIFIVSSLFWFLYIQFVIGMPLHITWLAPAIPVSTPFWITGTVMLIGQVYIYRKASRFLCELQLMLLGFSIMILSFLMLGAGRTEFWVVAASLTIVFGEMLFIPAFDLWVVRKVAEGSTGNPDRAMGTMHFFRSAGNMLGTCTAGLSFDIAKGLSLPGANWLFLAAVAGICSFYLYFRDASRTSPSMVAVKERS